MRDTLLTIEFPIADLDYWQTRIPALDEEEEGCGMIEAWEYRFCEGENSDDLLTILERAKEKKEFIAYLRAEYEEAVHVSSFVGAMAARANQGDVIVTWRQNGPDTDEAAEAQRFWELVADLKAKHATDEAA